MKLKSDETNAFSSSSVGLSSSFVEEHLQSQGSSLLVEIQQLVGFGRICSLRGIISILSEEILKQSTGDGLFCFWGGGYALSFRVPAEVVIAFAQWRTDLQH